MKKCKECDTVLELKQYRVVFQKSFWLYKTVPAYTESEAIEKVRPSEPSINNPEWNDYGNNVFAESIKEIIE